MLSSLLAMSKKLPEAQWAFVWDGVGKTWRHELLESCPSLEPVAQCEMSEKSKISNVFQDKKQDWMAQQAKQANAFVTRMLRPPSQSSGRPGTEPPAEPQTEKKPVPRERLFGYKANREIKDWDDDRLIPISQIPELKKVLRMLGFRQFEVQRLEGDDLMGILVTKLKDVFDDVIIQSGDRDFYQFIGPGVRQMKAMREGKPLWAEPEDIENEFGIKLEDWVKLKALIGDDTDNIPHLFKGVGPKTAARWLQDGLDPSLEEFESHSISVQKQFTILSVRKQDIPLAVRWSEVYRNFRLCKIITSSKAKEIRGCHEELNDQCVDLTVDGFRRNPAKNWLRWFSGWLVEWEMEQLYFNRADFGRIP